jgi:adenylate cyclase
MASVLNGYSYDIFISYRQADNKYDRWVSEFVANLKKELEATVKTKLSIFIDENPVDGLLETHNVDKSLSEKIKVLIFIPILSQTYCDPNSFAWQNELLAFNRLSTDDQFTNHIRLRSGNVTGRILPVRIHDLDMDDLELLQNELGGPLRAIDFVYKEPGVNRPLRPDDNEDKNLNKTKYRNQVNKVANSIKEILVSLLSPEKRSVRENEEPVIFPGSSSQSIAVLPFVNMSNDPDQEYFSDGISEEIINTLVQIPTLKVAGRTSAFSFKNKNEDLRSIGEKLNVNNILEGSVRKSGKNIRVSVQLIEASTGFHLWSQKFDRELNDVFIVQDEIANSIVEKLQVTFAGKPVETVERLHTPNVDAYQLYLKGRSLFYKRGLYVFDGLQCFEDALKIDPDYALALAGLADSYIMLCVHSYLPPEEAWTKAAEAANRAVQIGQGLAEVHSALATIAMLFERNWEIAQKEYLKALELNPRYLQGRSWYAMFYLQIMKNGLPEALKHARIAVEYDPLSSYAQAIFCTVASNVCLHDEAIAAAEKSVEYDPESFLAWFYLGYSNHWAGNLPEAIRGYRKAIDISGRHNWALTSLLALLAGSSPYQDKDEAASIYRELITKAKVGYVSPILLAISAAALGKKEDAAKYAQLSYTRHDPYFILSVQNMPHTKALHKIPEYKEILDKLSLSPDWYGS